MGEEVCKYCGVTDHPSHICNGFALRKEIISLKAKLKMAEEAIDAAIPLIRQHWHDGKRPGSIAVILLTERLSKLREDRKEL